MGDGFEGFGVHADAVRGVIVVKCKPVVDELRYVGFWV